MRDKLPKEWSKHLKEETTKEYFLDLQKKIDTAYSNKKVYPKKENLFRLFKLVQLESIKVVIIGQDPYHGPNQADGLAFSIQSGNKIPPSLKNIFNEIALSLKIYNHGTGNLDYWAKQGVFLMNSILSVEEGNPLSHKDLGWEKFTDAVIKLINEERKGVVFLLWGSKAIAKKKFINTKKNYVLESVHPSPLSAYRGFMGNNHFKIANELLLKQNKAAIDWSLK